MNRRRARAGGELARSCENEPPDSDAFATKHITEKFEARVAIGTTADETRG